MEDQIQTVEIIKQPGQTLGFYIREGNGVDKWSGVFVSRIAQGSVVAKNNLLQVNDEILSVNLVDVQRMSLDDVVILMSIAKRLVLTVKVNSNSRSDGAFSHTEVISPREQAHRDGRQPIVVLKSGFGTSSHHGKQDLSVDKKRHERNMANEHQLASQLKNEGYDTMPRYQMPLPFPHDYFPDQAYMLGPQHAFPSNQSEYRPELNYFFSKNSPLQYIQQQNQLQQQLEQQKQLQQFQQHQHQQQQQQEQLHRRSASDQMYRTLNRGLHYRLPIEWLEKNAGFLPNTSHVDRASHAAFQNQPMHFTRVNGNSADQYNSDSEIIPHFQKTRNKYRTFVRQSAGMSDLTFSRNSNLSKNKLGGSFADLSSLSLYGDYPLLSSHTANSQIPFLGNVPLPQKDYNAWLDQQLLQQSIMSASASKQMAQGKEAFQPCRLTRKLSTDSLLDYNIYKMNDSNNYAPFSHKLDNRLGSWISSSDTPFSKPSRSSSVSKQKPQFSHSLSRHKQVSALSSSTSLSSNKPHPPGHPSKLKSGPVSRMPNKLQLAEFTESPPVELAKGSNPITGLLRVNVLCGYGLKSNKTALRDLYCVIEVDSMPVARTTVRTGALNFDWNEDFDFEVCKVQKMQLLLYSWDMDTKHQLCFTATTPIAHVICSTLNQKKHSKFSQNDFKESEKDIFPIKLAIKLEPKGVLYTELSFTDSEAMFPRIKSTKKNGLFGAELKEVVLREKSGVNVPLIVQRCVNEIERRGLSQMGLYRLSCSNKRKTQLREEMEKNPRLADISPESVSDINVITGVLTDFFRELPEPLCTSSLHEMLLDALSVQVPGDVEGNTQLMLGILECLPRANQETLAFMLDHLKKVSSNSEVNKMTSEQIGLCLGPCLICPPANSSFTSPPSFSSDTFAKHAQLLSCLLDIWQQESSILASEQEMANKQEKIRSI